MSVKTKARPQNAPRSLTILGSTGSIGVNTLSLVDHSRERFAIHALTAQDNADLLAEQALRFKPALAVIGNEAHYHTLKNALSGSGIKVAAGSEAIVEAAQIPSDIVMAAIVGSAGLAPTLAAIRRGATIALANKETLVCAGALMIDEVKKHGATLLPVDSEHNAIFQVFDFDHPERIEKVTITASGGPFRNFTLEQMQSVTPEQAVKHPNWNMGAKISVDSATMMNKGLEMIEAYHLFPLSLLQIEVIVHPESIVHSMVSYVDGSVLAQMGTPDMRTPIAYALAWPERIATPAKKLDLATLGKLTFEAPDEQRFPALRLARETLQTGGSAPIIFNAANEVAVQRFLNKEIGFLDIAKTVEKALQTTNSPAPHTLEDIIAIDKNARSSAIV